MTGASAERQLLTCRLETPVRRTARRSGLRGGAAEGTPVRRSESETPVGHRGTSYGHSLNLQK